MHRDASDATAPVPHRQPLLLQHGGTPDPVAGLRAGLLAAQAAIAPRFFYDDLGSRLFAAITALDEYYPTRTEAGLIERHRRDIQATMPRPGCTFVDLGAGDCEKAAAWFDQLQPGVYVAVDVSVEFLRRALDCLQRRFPAIRMLGVGTDFTARLGLPAAVPPERRLCFYPGSSIGNFTPPAAVAWLATVRAELGAGGMLWIGVDLAKDPALLNAAYDDALGVTAAFNRNVLRHVNRLAGTDFALDCWRHVAFYNEVERRIEMHLEAVDEVAVRWPGGERHFGAGERILTEFSYKYTIAAFTEVLAAAGFAVHGCWTDERQWFAFFAAAPRAGGTA